METLPAPPLPGFVARLLPPGTRRYRLDVGGARMHVMEQGRGLPVLLLHGNPTWGFLWRKVAAALTGAPLRLVMPDLVGLGLSDKPRDLAAHSLLAHARWLGALLDALALERLVFVGQDWGGPIGLRALADRPGLLAGLVLLNTGVAAPRPGLRGSLFHRVARLPLASDLLFRGLGFPLGWLHRVQGDPGSIRGDVARAYRFPLRWPDNAAPLALARMVPDSTTHPSVPDLVRCEELVRGFTGPSALVWGDRDPILGRARARLERLLPRARVTRTAAGHFLQEEVPDEIAAAIRAVAAEVEA
ncbi:MAG TPA: alpha/beta fold hydrolase [Polyangia bacterium]|jgi:haloalkane dehalogenase